MYITVILVGICAGFGARGFDRKKGNIGIAIIAILATIICIIIGDIAETGIAFGSFDITPETYFEYLEFKFGEDPQQLFYYLAAIVVAGYFGYTTLNKD